MEISRNHNNSGTICIIEDVRAIGKLLATILEKSGFKAVTFENGKDSIEWLKNNYPLAVLVDILLPDINGSEIVKIIREIPNGNKIPFIAVTGFAQSSDREKYLKHGFDAYIPKPINTKTFADDVKKIIEMKKADS